MPVLRLAVATRCLKQPLRQAIATVAAMGATGVRLDGRREVKPAELSHTGRRQFLHRLREHGLEVASLDFPATRPLFAADRLEARLDALRQTMQLAYDLRCPIVTAKLMRLPEDPSAPEYALAREILDDLARFGNRVGTVLALTTVAEPPELLRRLVTEVAEGPVGVDFDPAALLLAGYDPIAAVSVFAETILHVEVRDAVRQGTAGGVEVPLGRGEVDWIELLGLLEDLPYRGWMAVERTEGDDPVGDCTRAVEYIQRVVHE